LRCGEALPVEGAPVKISAWESLELSQSKLLALLGTVVLIGLTLVLVIWKTQPVPEDDIARPISVPSVPSRVVPPSDAENAAPTGSSGAVPNTPSSAPMTPVDATRGGAAAYNSGNFDASRAAYEEAIAKNPDDAEALNNLGLSLVRLNKASEAVPRFERAVVLVPNKAAFHFNLAHAMGLLGRWDRAVAEYREAVRLFPEDYATQYNLASALHKKGDDKAAIPEFERAIALAPGEASFHLSLGMSLEQVGRVADAAREYEIYLQMAPGAPDAENLRIHLKALASARNRSTTP
jgi:Flp pilus assembly protein TadD